MRGAAESRTELDSARLPRQRQIGFREGWFINRPALHQTTNRWLLRHFIREKLPSVCDSV